LGEISRNKEHLTAARQHGGLEAASKRSSYRLGGRTKVQLCVSTYADEYTRQVGITSRKPGSELRHARCESPTYQVETKQTGGKMKHNLCSHSFAVLIAFAIGSLMSAMSALAAVNLNGQVLSGGGPVANSTVTLWAATAGAPAQLGQAR